LLRRLVWWSDTDVSKYRAARTLDGATTQKIRN